MGRKRLTRVERAMEFYRQLAETEPTSTAEHLKMAAATVRKHHYLSALLIAEIDSMSMRECRQYYAAVRKELLK